MADRAIPVLRPTEDFASMKRLAIESGLEEGTFENIVSAYGFYNGNELVGCAALGLKGGTYSLECLAVKDGLRHMGLGTRLVHTVEKEARARHAKQLWALARAPGFFKGVGFRARSAKDIGGPSLDGCVNCPQYRRNCSPEIVVKDL